MSSTDVERSKKRLTCPECGATGEATLQRGTTAEPEIKVISVTKDFTAIETKTVGTDPGFLCQRCHGVAH